MLIFKHWDNWHIYSGIKQFSIGIYCDMIITISVTCTITQLQNFFVIKIFKILATLKYTLLRTPTFGNRQTVLCIHKLGFVVFWGFFGRGGSWQNVFKLRMWEEKLGTMTTELSLTTAALVLGVPGFSCALGFCLGYSWDFSVYYHPCPWNET